MKSNHTATSETLKALILAGGRGKRLDGFTEEDNKCLLMFRGRPLMECSLDNARNLGIKEIVIVVGHQADDIISTYGRRYMGCTITYVIQKEQLGILHAMACAKRTLGRGDFLLMLGDEVFVNPQHKSMLHAFRAGDSFAICGVIRVEDRALIRKTYSIECNEPGKQILTLTEKPEHPTNHFMGTGNMVCRNELLDYLRKTPVNPKRGERELVGLIQSAIDDGETVRYHEIASGYMNINTAEDVATLKSHENETPKQGNRALNRKSGL